MTDIERFRLRRKKRLERREDEFNEGDHPRDENGQFASKGGVGGFLERLSKGEDLGKVAKEASKSLSGKEYQEFAKEAGKYLKSGKKSSDKSGSSEKERQLKYINEHNPMRDDVHTGIRSVEDIKTFEEAFSEEPSYPDITKDVIDRARKTGKITVYSSKNIKGGGFITPSKMMAKDYAGGGEVKSTEMDVRDIAWINPDEGQYVPRR